MDQKTSNFVQIIKFAVLSFLRIGSSGSRNCGIRLIDLRSKEKDSKEAKGKTLEKGFRMKFGKPHGFKHLKTGQVLLLAGAALVLVIGSAFLALSIKQDKMIRSQIEIAARNYFDSIIITRRWSTGYNGVYVLKKEGMVSNPYLKNPDIITRDGIVYTMKNPALMTREISDLAKANSGYQYHITSLNLVNPSNAPDAWERQSLELFETGVKETSLKDQLNGKKIFRFMRPLIFETGCMDCHGTQGYKEGAVGGGISVILPYDKIALTLGQNRIQMLALALLVLACFGAVFYLGVWQLFIRLNNSNAKLVQERGKLEQLNVELDHRVDERTLELITANKKLQKSEADFRSFIDQSNDAIFIISPDNAQFSDANHHACEMLGYTREELLSMGMPDIDVGLAKDFIWEGHIRELRQRPNMLLESIHKRKDNTTFPVEVNIRLFMLDNQEYMVSAARDISERRAAEKELQNYRKNLEKLVDERTEKLAGKTRELERSQKALEFLLEDVNEVKNKLEDKNNDLERFNRLLVDRELRMVELKEDIRDLEDKLNGPQLNGPQLNDPRQDHD
jgi:PAS domain S-box-containing protein